MGSIIGFTRGDAGRLEYSFFKPPTALQRFPRISGFLLGVRFLESASEYRPMFFKENTHARIFEVQSTKTQAHTLHLPLDVFVARSINMHHGMLS